MHRFHHFTATWVAALTASALPLVHWLFHEDVVRTLSGFLERLDDSWFYETTFLVALVLSGYAMDLLRNARRRRAEHAVQEDQLHVLHATIRTVQDITGNVLNGVQLLMLDAEEGSVTPESLAVLDGQIVEAAAKLKALGDSERFVEVELAIGTGVACPAGPVPVPVVPTAWTVSR